MSKYGFTIVFNGEFTVVSAFLLEWPHGIKFLQGVALVEAA